MTLAPKEKCLVRFVRDKCDSAGVWEPNWVLAQVHIDPTGNAKVTEADLLAINGGKQFEKLDSGKIFCTDFIEFQYGQLSPDCRPHQKIISTLQKHGLYERVFKGYSKGIQTLQEEDKDKDKGKGRGKRQGDLGKSENPLDFSAFDDPERAAYLWGEWMKYRKHKDSFSYSANQYEQTGINGLTKKSNAVVDVAAKIMSRSIENGWTGLFPLPENEVKNGSSSKRAAELAAVVTSGDTF